jgi:hypothetical protein
MTIGRIAVTTATRRHRSHRNSHGKSAQIRARTGNSTMLTAVATKTLSCVLPESNSFGIHKASHAPNNTSARLTSVKATKASLIGHHMRLPTR